MIQEQRAAEEERLRKEKEMDYLAPFLARLGDPPTLTKEQAQRVHDDCLQDLKTRLIDVANIIQTRYEQVRELNGISATNHAYKFVGNNCSTKTTDRISAASVQREQAR